MMGFFRKSKQTGDDSETIVTTCLPRVQPKRFPHPCRRPVQRPDRLLGHAEELATRWYVSRWTQPSRPSVQSDLDLIKDWHRMLFCGFWRPSAYSFNFNYLKQSVVLLQFFACVETLKCKGLTVVFPLWWFNFLLFSLLKFMSQKNEFLQFKKIN